MLFWVDVQDLNVSEIQFKLLHLLLSLKLKVLTYKQPENSPFLFAAFHVDVSELFVSGVVSGPQL